MRLQRTAVPYCRSLVVEKRHDKSAFAFAPQSYDDKITHLLNNRNVYQILSVGGKSIEILEIKVNELVCGFAKKNEIRTPVYHQLKSDKVVVPKFCSLPKIHKSDVSLRPIVSFSGALTYCLAKLFVGILSVLLSLEYTKGTQPV